MIDYTADFPNAIAAHAEGRNVLILSRLPELYQRADGVSARYELEYRWLSRDARPDTDDYVCVQGAENTYYTPTELLTILTDDKHWHRSISPKKLKRALNRLSSGTTSLFDCFNLF